MPPQGDLRQRRQNTIARRNFARRTPADRVTPEFVGELLARGDDLLHSARHSVGAERQPQDGKFAKSFIDRDERVVITIGARTGREHQARRTAAFRER